MFDLSVVPRTAKMGDTRSMTLMFGLAGGSDAGTIAWIAAAVAIFAVLVALVLARAVFVIVPEYERVVFFRFGRVISEARGPGLIFKFPIMDRVVKVNLRVEVVDIPSQAVITKDNVTIQVDAVIYFQVVEPIRAVIGVDNFRFASQRIAMTSLRSIIGRYELDSLLEHREDINSELRATIARHTTEWGVDVRQVEIRDITLPPELLRAMAKQAEAERERRAKIIAASGELQASQELSEAADRLTASPGALQLRTLQTLAEVATERNSTLIFPIPVELLGMFQRGVPAAVPAVTAGPAGPAELAGPTDGADAEGT
jgi:regulator of protease activity HflC (stomatin/prohibitin superfamily)